MSASECHYTAHPDDLAVIRKMLEGARLFGSPMVEEFTKAALELIERRENAGDQAGQPRRQRETLNPDSKPGHEPGHGRFVESQI